MRTRNSLIENIFKVNDSISFNQLCLEIFAYQYERNHIYQQFCNYLNRNPANVISIDDIPFLPIEFFKNHEITCEPGLNKKIFKSSGTTGSTPSQHLIFDLELYEKSFLKSFEIFFGAPTSYVFLGLLPSYLEREDSSLVYMVNHFIKISPFPESGFYLKNYAQLYETINQLREKKIKIWLIGVSFALIDFFEQKPELHEWVTIIETGGMKGRKKEMIKADLHHLLRQQAPGNWSLGGEYGMTELLSQAYAINGMNYKCPPWMQIKIYDLNDPFSSLPHHKTGAVNVIDLANLDSCSFIATQDLGRTAADGTFEILGRFDNSDLRGCNLMVV